MQLYAYFSTKLPLFPELSKLLRELFSKAYDSFPKIELHLATTTANLQSLLSFSNIIHHRTTHHYL